MLREDSGVARLLAAHAWAVGAARLCLRRGLRAVLLHAGAAWAVNGTVARSSW
ncbi:MULTISPECIES: hypothetical protein [Streptomyces]|uniref:hypothetical protein n=1 Tax=Streptomyces TaxID=1883 RepID=UPI00186AC218|nr:MULTISPECIES: hypothetical protein [Streptomyces]